MDALLGWPCSSFLWVAAVVSVYQGWRGFYFQWVWRTGGIVGPGSPMVSAWVFVLARCAADAIFYSLSTALGFAALLFDYRILRSAPAIKDMSAGAVAMVVFLTLFGLGGVTGQLPYQLQQGK